MKRLLGWVLASPAILGCAPSGETTPALGHMAIVGGEPSNAAEDAVVQITVPSTETLCSGTLVARNVVMTALHCVAQFDPFGTFSCDTDGVLVTSTPPDGEIGATVDPAEIQIHAGVIPDAVPDAYASRVFGSGSGVICRNDIALVVLDRDLDAPTVPMRMARPTRRGEPMLVVGYGRTEQAASTGRFRRAGLSVGDVGSSLTGVVSGRAAPNTFVLGPGACQGASGGPALSEETGAIVGVYSLSAGIACTSSLIRNIYTQVAPYSALIERAFEFAGTQPMPEAPVGGGSSGMGSGGGSGTAGSNAIGSGGLATGLGGTAAELGGTTAATSSPGSGRNTGDGCSMGASMGRSPRGLFAAWLLVTASLFRRKRPRGFD